jgi:ankyrin repeat protein
MRAGILLLAVMCAGGDGSTPLHWAAYKDDVAAARRLIAEGAQVNAANDLGVTPLWLASQNGSLEVVGALLRAGANVNAALESGETPLMAAARGGKTGAAKLLLDGGAKLEARATRGQTALMWAAAQKHPAMVKLLLAYKADLHARSDSWSQMMATPPHGHPDYNRQIPHGHYTALLFAVRGGDVESVNLLLAAGANPNDADAWGVTATVLASHTGHTELVKLLLGKGANPNLAEAGFTALHIAIMRRDEEMARALLEHGADANTPLMAWTPTRRSSRDFHFEPALVGASPLWLAARFQQPSIMRLLAARGADAAFVHKVDYLDGERQNRRKEATTVLMAAMGMGRGRAWVEAPLAGQESAMLETVKLAVELGADVNALNHEGRTALDAAKAMGDAAVVGILMAHGSRTATR